MPLFLDNDQLYRVVQRELPPDVFPDGVPSAYYHTADFYSAAGRLADAYTALSGIYEESFPQSCSLERIGDWEVKVFGPTPAAGSPTLEERVARVLSKLRTRLGITKADAKAIVLTAVPTLNPDDVEIWEWNLGEGMWVLDVSELDTQTGLGGGQQFIPNPGPTLCEDDPADYGMTPEEWDAVREAAYTYEVRIYNYTLTAEERAAITAALLQFGRYSCQFIITDGLTEADR